MQKKSANRNWRKSDRVNPPVTALTYSGPIQTIKDKLSVNTITALVVETFTISSDSSGNVTNVMAANPSGGTNWSDFAALYDEYRVLGMEVRYFPNDRYDPGLTQHQRPLIVVNDHNGNAALTSYNSAANFGSAKIKSTGDPWRQKIFMDGTGEAQWVNTANTPPDLMYIKIFATGLAVSSEYGRVFQYFRVQFKSRGS